MVTMQKYLIDLQAKGVTVPPPEFKLSNLIDLYTQIETLEAESKLFAGIIRQLNDELKRAADLAIALEEYFRVFDNPSVDNDDMPYLLEEWTSKARQALEEWKLAQ